jgi:hypothetical protein
MWYEVRSGDAYMAAGELPKALKKYTSVSKHFAGMCVDTGVVTRGCKGI